MTGGVELESHPKGVITTDDPQPDEGLRVV
jgi:hypothetical protein